MASGGTQLRITRKWSGLKAILSQARLARSNCGKRVLSQALEMALLRLGAGKLSPHEYYLYRLYDDRHSWAEKRSYLGRHWENGLIPVLREQGWVGLANDKLASYAFLAGQGLPVPETYAVYHPVRSFGKVPTLRTRSGVAEFLARKARFPLVVKPVYGMYGADVYGVAAYDAAKGEVSQTNGVCLSLEELLDRFERWRQYGALFQELLVPHPDIEAWCGRRICTVRMVSVIDQRGPRLICTAWRVASGTRMADNYVQDGNLLASVDVQTGRVGRPFTDRGLAQRYVDAHPDTGMRLWGVVLPDWGAAVEMCLRATSSLPGLPMQAWDVALTDRGPVLLEFNVNGGMRPPQLAADAGLYAGEFKDFLGGFGYPRQSPIRALLRSLRLHA